MSWTAGDDTGRLYGPRAHPRDHQLSAQSLSAPSSNRSTGLRHLRRQLMHQLRPFLLDQLSHIVGDFWEALRLKQELVQPFEILLHHDMVGDNPRCEDTLRFHVFSVAAVCAL